MSAAKRATLVLVMLGLGVVAWSGPARLRDAVRCRLPAAAADAGSGCCYYNTGVCDCEQGRARCCDGALSASCGCSNEPPFTRRITVDARALLGLADVAFASQEVPEPPNLGVTLFRMGAGALRFWFKLDCGDNCWNRVAVNDVLPLQVRWLFDPGSGPMFDSALTISLHRNRPSVFVARPLGAPGHGHWETEVRFSTERLCTRGEDRCWFPVEVRR